MSGLEQPLLLDQTRRGLGRKIPHRPLEQTVKGRERTRRVGRADFLAAKRLQFGARLFPGLGLFQKRDAVPNCAVPNQDSGFPRATPLAFGLPSGFPIIFSSWQTLC